MMVVCFATAAFAAPLPVTPVAPVPGPSFSNGTQFGDLLIGPISVHFAAADAFSGWLRAYAYESPTNITFVYRIEMEAIPVGGTVDLFELATLFPPDLAIDEIVDVGYNTYYSGVNANAAPATIFTGSEEGYSFIDFNFKNPEGGDNTGLPSGVTTELFIKTTKNVDINTVYAVFINAGADVQETISGVVSFGPPPQEVPEPGTMMLVIGGLAGVLAAVRKRTA